MPQKAAFRKGQHCLLRQNQSSENEIQYILEIITWYPSIYTIDYLDITVSVFMQSPICLKSDKLEKNCQLKINTIGARFFQPSAVHSFSSSPEFAVCVKEVQLPFSCILENRNTILEHIIAHPPIRLH